MNQNGALPQAAALLIRAGGLMLAHLRWAIVAGIGAMGAASASSASAAETFVPEVSLPATHATLANRNIDILSLAPGMSPKEAREVLLALPAPQTMAEQMTSFGIASRGVEVQTAQFVQAMTSGEDSDRVEVRFTGPASDNQTYAVERTVNYPEVLSAPSVDAIAEALTAKYGTPSYNARDFREPPAPELIWVFRAGEQLPCQGFGGYGNGQMCPFASTMLEYAPEQLAGFAREPLDFDYAIVAKIKTHEADRTKSAGFTVTVSDLLRRKQAASADAQSLIEEVERVHRQASKPAPAPSM